MFATPLFLTQATRKSYNVCENRPNLHMLFLFFLFASSQAMPDIFLDLSIWLKLMVSLCGPELRNGKKRLHVLVCALHALHRVNLVSHASSKLRERQQLLHHAPPSCQVVPMEMMQSLYQRNARLLVFRDDPWLTCKSPHETRRRMPREHTGACYSFVRQRKFREEKRPCYLRTLEMLK